MRHGAGGVSVGRPAEGRALGLPTTGGSSQHCVWMDDLCHTPDAAAAVVAGLVGGRWAHCSTGWSVRHRCNKRAGRRSAVLHVGHTAAADASQSHREPTPQDPRWCDDRPHVKGQCGGARGGGRDREREREREIDRESGEGRGREREKGERDRDREMDKDSDRDKSRARERKIQRGVGGERQKERQNERQSEK